MKKNALTAVRFRLLLSVVLVIIAAMIIGAFVFGYQYLSGVGEETAAKQADATASEDSITGLQRLRTELETKTDIIEQLGEIRSTNSLPQFDTERSLRTIAQQLQLPIKSISFVSQSEASASASAGSQSSATSSWGTASTITFEFNRTLSYNELLTFLNAIETSTPKLRVTGVNLPDGSTRQSIEVGSLTLELATL